MKKINDLVMYFSFMGMVAKTEDIEKIDNIPASVHLALASTFIFHMCSTLPS